MGTTNNLVGNKYHDLEVIEDIPRKVIVRCKCGTVKEVDVANLLSGRITGCGCNRKGSHYPTYTEADRVKVCNLFDNGVSRKKIVEKTGYSYAAVCRFIREK